MKTIPFNHATSAIAKDRSITTHADLIARVLSAEKDTLRKAEEAENLLYDGMDNKELIDIISVELECARIVMNPLIIELHNLIYRLRASENSYLHYLYHIRTETGVDYTKGINEYMKIAKIKLNESR